MREKVHFTRQTDQWITQNCTTGLNQLVNWIGLKFFWKQQRDASLQCRTYTHARWFLHCQITDTLYKLEVVSHLQVLAYTIAHELNQCILYIPVCAYRETVEFWSPKESSSIIRGCTAYCVYTTTIKLN